MGVKYRNTRPSTVATGDIAVYPNSLGQICTLNDSGVETCFIGSDDVPSPSPRYEAFDSDGALSLTPAYQILTMESEVETVPGFSLSGGGVQVANAGSFKYDFKASGDSTDGDRATLQAAIFVNGVEVPRTRAFAYHRSLANGEDTATSSGVLVLAANDVVTLQALILGDNVLTIPNASNLVLEVNQ